MVSHRKNPLVLTRTRCWTAVFAFGPLSSSYLCRLYWAFHFLCPWLNIRCSKLSSDIKQGVRFNFEVSERLFKLKCLPLLLSLICIGCASKHCSQFLSPLCHLSIKFFTSPPPWNCPLPFGWQIIRVVLWSINIWTSGIADQANIIFLEMQPVSSTAPFAHYLVLCLLLSGDYRGVSGQPSTVCLLKLRPN